MIKAVLNVEAPRQHVYSILTDFSHYSQWLPGCVESKVVSSSGNTVDMEVTVTGIKTMTMGLRYEMQPDQFLNFRMIKGKELKAYSGSWKLMDSADGSGTVVMGEMEMEASVPAFMLNRMAKKAIDDAGEALKKRARLLPAPPAKAPAPAEILPGVVAPKARPRRSKRVLHVMRIPGGYRVWVMGEAFFLQDKVRK
ncbi:MAG TPA: SRPBCC family protein [Acidobacteriota bacterium]|jgi:ribosome-associated toxin RatA of RatAB toxin-antitoxin module|nr:SRPBCC family protein [Acidobacteriota bacterium]